ncbi:MAG: hypothetical protein ACE5JB_06695 [bacterium]
MKNCFIVLNGKISNKILIRYSKMFRGILSVILFYCFFSLLNPTVYAGAWTLKRGQLWIKSSVFYQKTDKRYYSRNQPCPLIDCRKGQQVPFPFNGESRVTAVYWDINYGLTDQIELDLQIPFFDISFKDDPNPLRPKTSSVGDIRFGARYRFISKPIVSTIGVAAKAPTGLFNKDAEFVPIGDGQWDFEIQGQFGRSLWPLPGYVNVDIGYRFRFEPDIETSDLDPGNEFYFRGEAGYNIRRNILIKAALDGFWGERFTNRGTHLKFIDSERNILYFEPGIYWMFLAPWAAEASVKFSLSGKNYPSGQIFGFGLSYMFSL